MTALAESAVPVVAKLPKPRFYVRSAAAILAVGVLGFAPTYWVPLARGMLVVPPIVHLHALVFYGWLVLFLVQTRLAAARKFERHRELGVASVSVATAMCFIGVAVAVASMRRGDAQGFGPASRAFAIVPLSTIATFAVTMIFALRHARAAQVHKRLMLVATAPLLSAGIGRWFVLFLAPHVAGPTPPPPVAVTVLPSLLADLFIVAGMVYDRRTRGRVHPVYWIGLAGVVAVQVLRVPLATTGLWLRVADWVQALVP